MMSKKWMMVMLLGVGLAWYLWTPLPADLDQRGMFMALGVFNKLTKPLVRLASFLPVYSNRFQPTRALIAFLIRPPALDSDPELQVTNEIFSGVQVRVYRPKSAVEPLLPVLMYFHGGGWSIGSIDAEDLTSRYLARTAKVIVVSVEYRLAPEHPFPAALDDCLTATRHVLTEGLQKGMDSTRVGVIGYSAGGNLASAVSLRLLDPEFSSLPKLSYQVLMAPAVQSLDFNLPSYTENTQVSDIILTQEEIVQFHLSYAGLPITPSNVEQVCKGQHIREQTRRQWTNHIHPDLLTGKVTFDKQTKGDAVNETLASMAEPVLLNYLLSPPLAPDHLLKRVPRAMLIISQYDVLRDENLLYVRRLRNVGVDVTSHVIKNGHHLSMLIFTSEPGSEITSYMYDQIVKFIAD